MSLSVSFSLSNAPPLERLLLEGDAENLCLHCCLCFLCLNLFLQDVFNCLADNVTKVGQEVVAYTYQPVQQWRDKVFKRNTPKPRYVFHSFHVFSTFLAWLELTHQLLHLVIQPIIITHPCWDWKKSFPDTIHRCQCLLDIPILPRTMP